MNDICNTWGVAPRRIVSDNGREFKNKGIIRGPMIKGLCGNLVPRIIMDRLGWWRDTIKRFGASLGSCESSIISHRKDACKMLFVDVIFHLTEQ